MGGTPAMSGVGRARSRLVQGGLWYACELEQEQRLDDGTFVLAWRLAWVTGWDGRAREYRASSADNQGPNLGLYRGRLDGSRFVYESLLQEQPSIRLTWELVDADHCLWRNESSVDGVTWTLIEEYEMRVQG